jgi:hypothetical protein
MNFKNGGNIMSFHTWSTNGFGICVDDIYRDVSLTTEKILKLAAMEPSVLKIVQEYIDEINEIVKLKFQMSKLVIQKNYYKKVLGG